MTDEPRIPDVQQQRNIAECADRNCAFGVSHRGLIQAGTGLSNNANSAPNRERSDADNCQKPHAVLIQSPSFINSMASCNWRNWLEQMTTAPGDFQPAEAKSRRPWRACETTTRCQSGVAESGILFLSRSRLPPKRKSTSDATNVWPRERDGKCGLKSPAPLKRINPGTIQCRRTLFPHLIPVEL